MKKALGIDLGGTKIAVAIVDEKGKIIGNTERFATPKTKKEIVEILKTITSKYEKEVDFFALATAGAVNNENTAVIGSTANLPKGYKDIDFQSLSSKKVFMRNNFVYFKQRKEWA